MKMLILRRERFGVLHALLAFGVVFTMNLVLLLRDITHICCWVDSLLH